jgi:hypothetical protein
MLVSTVTGLLRFFAKDQHVTRLDMTFMVCWKASPCLRTEENLDILVPRGLRMPSRTIQRCDNAGREDKNFRKRTLMSILRGPSLYIHADDIWDQGVPSEAWEMNQVPNLERNCDKSVRRERCR